MSKRRGYNEEYAAKQRLLQTYGKGHVVKAAVSQTCPDFLCFQKVGIGHLVTAYEIKGRHKKKVTLTPHDREQLESFERWNATTGIPVKYWLAHNHPDTKKTKWFEYTLEEFKKRYYDTN